MVVLVATSCKKNEQSTSFNVGFGEVTGFEAAPSLDGSKAYIDVFNGGVFKWNENDKIVVYNLSSDYTDSKSAVYTAQPGSEGKTFTVFSGELIGGKKDIGYFLFYHPDKAHRDLQAGNMETFTVSETQTYDPTYLIDPTSLVMASTVGEANGHVGGNFTLQHIFGILNIGIGDVLGGKQVRNIKVTDAQWHLSGELSLKLPEVSASTFTSLINQCESTNGGDAYLTALSTYLNQLGYNAEGEGKTITLECNDINLPYLQWQYFFISLRPGALYKGFTVRVNFTDNTYIEKEFGPNINYLIKPGYFRNIFLDTAGNLY